MSGIVSSDKKSNNMPCKIRHDLLLSGNASRSSFFGETKQVSSSKHKLTETVGCMSSSRKKCRSDCYQGPKTGNENCLDSNAEEDVGVLIYNSSATAATYRLKALTPKTPRFPDGTSQSSTSRRQSSRLYKRETEQKKATTKQCLAVNPTTNSPTFIHAAAASKPAPNKLRQRDIEVAGMSPSERWDFRLNQLHEY